jgi:hypothetical protein
MHREILHKVKTILNKEAGSGEGQVVKIVSENAEPDY